MHRIASVFIVSFLIGSLAHAGERFEASKHYSSGDTYRAYARVVDVDPLVRRRLTDSPTQSCRWERPRHPAYAESERYRGAQPLAHRHHGVIPTIVGGLIATLMHLTATLWHQLGHAIAARRTGHPMMGVRLWLLLGASVYPHDEGDLPAAVHIQRALGGPIANLVLTILVGGVALILDPSNGVAWWLFVFWFLDNSLIFTLGALLPLGFNDGSTILHWLGQ